MQLKRKQQQQQQQQQQQKEHHEMAEYYYPSPPPYEYYPPVENGESFPFPPQQMMVVPIGGHPQYYPFQQAEWMNGEEEDGINNYPIHQEQPQQIYFV